MPWFLTLYLILVLASIAVRAVGSAKKNDKLDMYGVLAALAAGTVLAIGLATLDDSRVSGAYIYKVNGVRVASGTINILEAVFMGIMGGAVPSLIGLGIGECIRKAAQKKASDRRPLSLLGKIGCVFFLAEGGFGLISGILRVVSSEEKTEALVVLLVSAVFLVPGVLLLSRWRRR